MMGRPTRTQCASTGESTLLLVINAVLAHLLRSALLGLLAVGSSTVVELSTNNFEVKGIQPPKRNLNCFSTAISVLTRGKQARLVKTLMQC